MVVMIVPFMKSGAPRNAPPGLAEEGGAVFYPARKKPGPGPGSVEIILELAIAG
ncbi:hypothetical protein [Pseudooceanicola nanhaiensis]|uniref:hypothetical protein n=1 Tax=Pseudooceanicola nanhaiensis TaxID=375761 RepID=UPI004059A8C0